MPNRNNELKATSTIEESDEFESKAMRLFTYLSVISVSCVLVSNILASKLIEVAGFSMTAGVLLFPVAYIVGDVIAEIFGYKKSKRVIYMGFLCNLLMVICFKIAILMPFPEYWENQEAFVAILGNTPRIFLASVFGYLVGSLSNSYVLNLIKKKSKISFLSFRTIVSSIVGEILDTSLFLIIGFIGNIETNTLLSMICIQSFVKILYEIILTPVTVYIINLLKNKIV